MLTSQSFKGSRFSWFTRIVLTLTLPFPTASEFRPQPRSLPDQRQTALFATEPHEKGSAGHLLARNAGLEPIFFAGLAKGLRSVLGSRKFRIVLAKAKTHPIARGLAGPGLLAHVIVSKVSVR
jgi:hypothetical protein